MRYLKKIFACAIASSMLISSMAINAFAKDAVATLTADKTTDLKPGDIVTVTITLDDTKGYSNIKYTLNYPTDVFTIDTAENTAKYEEYEEEYDPVPNYYDADWYYAALDSAAFLKKLNTIVSAPEIDDVENGKITLSATNATSSITSTKGVDCVIGKYYLKVKDTPKAGASSITLTGGNADPDLVIGTITCNDLSVTVAGGDDDDDDEPVTPPATTVEKAVQATVTSYNEKMTGVLFTAVDGSNKGQYVVRFNGAVEAGNVKVGLKVTGVPATNNLTITAENYYGTAATGVLNK